MATTDAQVCNIALLRVGERQTIDSLEEKTTAAKACKVLYAESRNAVLEAVDWPFARRRAVLAALANAARDGWGYTYALPADCIAPRKLWSGVRREGAGQPVPFAVEDDAATDARVLLTDMSPATLLYTAAITNPTRFSPLFVQALAWKLAAELVLGLPLKPHVAPAMERKYQLAIAEAAAAAANQQVADVEPEPEHLRARR